MSSSQILPTVEPLGSRCPSSYTLWLALKQYHSQTSSLNSPVIVTLPAQDVVVHIVEGHLGASHAPAVHVSCCRSSDFSRRADLWR